MFNKKKKLQKSFKTINKHIDSLTLSDEEKRNLKGLLRNVKVRTEVA
ncbi:hypothetical protein [Streptococcus porci]|nr:hypothetical protein [Streptococcus porci]